MTAFKSDGCTVIRWMDRELGPDGKYHRCCVSHDYEYWRGGTEEDRLRADRTLRDCWICAGMEWLRARVYFWAVRVAGSGYWPGPPRWSGRKKDEYLLNRRLPSRRTPNERTHR